MEEKRRRKEGREEDDSCRRLSLDKSKGNEEEGGTPGSDGSRNR